MQALPRGVVVVGNTSSVLDRAKNRASLADREETEVFAGADASRKFIVVISSMCQGLR